jgi:hypothetical protein
MGKGEMEVNEENYWSVDSKLIVKYPSLFPE